MEHTIKEAKTGDMARVYIDHQNLNLKINVIDGNVYGDIGCFRYDLTRLQKKIDDGKIPETEARILEFCSDEDEFYGYKPRDLFEITDYVHRFKIGKRDGFYLINYKNKLWSAEVFNFFPDGMLTLQHLGGVYYSLDEYIKACIERDTETAHVVAARDSEWCKSVFG